MKCHCLFMTLRFFVILFLIPVPVLAQFRENPQDRFILDTGNVRWEFDASHGLSIARVSLKSDDGEQSLIYHQGARPLFDLSINQVLPADSRMNAQGQYDWQPGPGRISHDSWLLKSAERTVSDKGRNELTFVHEAETSAGTVRLAVQVVEQDESTVVFHPELLALLDDRYLKTTLRGPILEEMLPGEDSWYFFPRGHGTFNKNPCRMASYYGQYVWMQCMGLWSEKSGATVSIIPTEHEAQPKLFITQKAGPENERVIGNSYNAPLHEDLKNTEGITQAIVWPDWVAEIGQPSVYGPIAVKVFQSDDWRDIYRPYQDYLKTWWNPRDRRRQWVRHCYTEGTQWAEVANNIDEYVAWALPHHGWIESTLSKPMSLSRYLEYSLVGKSNPEGIRTIFRQRRQHGVRSTVYVHGKAIDPKDRFAIEHAYDLTLDTPPVGEAGGGPPGTGATDGLHWINMHAPLWRQWLGSTCQDILKRSEADGIRLDCIGFTMFGGASGANPRIDTPPTQHDSMVRSSVEVVEYVRRSMNEVDPSASLGAENLGTDLMMNLLDYSLCYNLWELCWQPPDEYPSPVNYIRFVIPDFKYFEIVGEPHYDGGVSRLTLDMRKTGSFTVPETHYREALHTTMFNGVGAAGWCRAPDHLDLLSTLERALGENTHIIESGHCLPEIFTLQEGLYANWFSEDAEGRQDRIVTLMNWTRKPISGEMLEVDLKENEQVIDMVRLKLAPVSEGIVNFDLEPMRSAVLRVIPSRITAKRNGDSIDIQLQKPLDSTHKLIAYTIEPDGRILPVAVQMKSPTRAIISSARPENRYACQLMHLHYSDEVNDRYVIEDMAIVEADTESPRHRMYARIEAEEVCTVQNEGGVIALDTDWQRFSDARQLGWHRTQKENKLEIPFSAPIAGGRYKVSAAFTTGPAYGSFDVSLKNRIRTFDYQGRPQYGLVDATRVDREEQAGPVLDFFSEEPGTTGKVSLGIFDLPEQNNLLFVRSEGSDEKRLAKLGFDYEQVKAAFLYFKSAPGHKIWIDRFYFSHPNEKGAPVVLPEDPDEYSEEKAWWIHFCAMPEPSRTERDFNFPDWASRSPVAIDSDNKAHGLQSILHTNPGWPRDIDVAFGVYRSRDAHRWKLGKEWKLHMDVRTEFAADPDFELILMDAAGNFLRYDLSSLSRYSDGNFVQVVVSISEMRFDTERASKTSFGIDYLMLESAE